MVAIEKDLPEGGPVEVDGGGDTWAMRIDKAALAEILAEMEGKPAGPRLEEDPGYIEGRRQRDAENSGGDLHAVPLFRRSSIG
jgi:hypothetical protein